jgi:hypothetical protein
MEMSRTALTRRLKEVAQELFHEAFQLEGSLKNSSMSLESEKFWLGESRRAQINRLRATARQIHRRAVEQL